jgi:hypothetical protein
MSISDEELQIVSSLAEKQLQIEEQVAELETNLELAKEALKKVSELDLPSAMAEIGMTAFTLTSGRKIVLKTDVYASIPKDNTQRAFAWLREHEFGSLIKNVISAEFGKGEDALAIEAATVLAEAGFKPTQKESVHPMTLKAFINEQLKEGKEIPLDYFGAFIVTKSKVLR